MSLSEILMLDTTGPPFWLSPVLSKLRTVLPANIAAVLITKLVVTTPVPPMPIM